MAVVTRFAPSPTGFLHIGGARTALFNWLFARHHGGIFRLRIEDTDRARSTTEAIDKILDALRWLGLAWDGPEIYQSQNAARHAAVAHELLTVGKAYRCYCSPEELVEMRQQAKQTGTTRLYDGRWRDRDPAEAPPGIDPVVRIKMPLVGETVVEDGVQGQVRVTNAQLDDLVLLRADGTPTYMLSVVVDDHDMDVTHIIRGDDHLTNAFRQAQLYAACGWTAPIFAHIPLIHGADGGKLSKRHGALGVEAYRDMGYLPEALCNTLLRLGWGHGDDEIIGLAQAIEWFDLADVGRAAARFDLARLDSVNGHYIREADDERLVELIMPRLTALLGRPPSVAAHDRLGRGIGELKQRVKTLLELSENALFYCHEVPLPISDKAAKLLDQAGRQRLLDLAAALDPLEPWSEAALDAAVRAFAEAASVKLGDVAQPLRAALTGATASPGIFEVMAVLGRDETMARLRGAQQQA